MEKLSEKFIQQITDEQLIAIISERISKQTAESNKLQKYIDELNSIKNNQVSLLNKTKNDLLAQMADLSNRLAHSEEHRSRFLSIVRNIFTNPLFGILTIVETTQTEMTQNPELKNNEEVSFLRENIDMLNRELLYLNFQINNIVAAAEIENAELEKNVSNFDLRNLVDDVIQSLKFTIQDGLISIKRDIEEPIIMNQDQEKISLILVNLISNAINLSQGHDFVKVRAFVEQENSTDEEFVTIEIVNNGIFELKEKEIFTAFKQLNDDYNRESQGMGLGLTIVKAFVDFLEAKVGFYSKDEHTVFYVKFKTFGLNGEEDSFSVIDENFEFDFNFEDDDKNSGVSF